MPVRCRQARPPRFTIGWTRLGSRGLIHHAYNKEEEQAGNTVPPRTTTTTKPTTTTSIEERLSRKDYSEYIKSIHNLALHGDYVKVKYLSREILQNSNTKKETQTYITSQIMLAHTNHLIKTISASRNESGDIDSCGLLPQVRNGFTPFTNSFYESFPEEDDEPVHWTRRLEFLSIAHSVNPIAFPYSCFQNHLNQQIASGSQVSLQDIYLSIYCLVSSPQFSNQSSLTFANKKKWTSLCTLQLNEIFKILQKVSRPFDYKILENIKTYGLILSGLKQGTQDYRSCVATPRRDYAMSMIYSAIQLSKKDNKRRRMMVMDDDRVVKLSRQPLEKLESLYKSYGKKRNIRQCAYLDNRAIRLVKLSNQYNIPWSVDFVILILTTLSRGQDFKLFWNIWKSIGLSGINPTRKLITIMCGLVVSSRNQVEIENLLLNEISIGNDDDGIIITISGVRMALSTDLYNILKYALEQVDPTFSQYKKLGKLISCADLNKLHAPMYTWSDIRNYKWDWAIQFL